MINHRPKNNLLAVRVQPWQLFRFKRYVLYAKKKPSVVIQEALQIYFSSITIPEAIKTQWLNDYQDENRSAA